MNNAISDLIIRIKNGYQAKKEQIESPYSIFRERVLKKLIPLGFIKGYEVKGGKIKKLIIELQYDDGVAVFTDVKLFSTPGRRWYVSSKELKAVMGGFGVAILSTPKGILTGSEAKKEHVGGELLFEIW